MCIRDRAEAINTSAVLYRVTKDAAYADDYAAFLKYLDEVVLDHKQGSWFHQLDQMCIRDRSRHFLCRIFRGQPAVFPVF